MSYVDAQQQAEAEAEAAQDPLGKHSPTKGKKMSLIEVSEEDRELFKVSAEEEAKITKLQAVYRGRTARRSTWNHMGGDQDEMARKLQDMNRDKTKKTQRRAS